MSESDLPFIHDRFRRTDKERFEQFSAIRREVIDRVQKETTERIQNNPIPTATEDEIGAYIEMLEPQVRDAVLLLREKGYATESSGFGGQQQAINQKMTLNGRYLFDADILNRLAALRVQIRTNTFRGHTLTHLRFQPNEADLAKITMQWNAIAEILPPTGHQAFPAVSNRAIEFRTIYAKGSPYLQEWVQHFWSQPEEQ